jgi:uncharacterized protein YdaU (DUF1376 family)
VAGQWYPHYPGDYGRDTADLSMMEHGAYRLLLDHYYSTGAALPTDRVRLYRVCHAVDPAEQRAVDTVLVQFFALEDDGYHNQRADRELAKRIELRSTLSESGRRGAERRWRRPSTINGQANGHPNGHPNGPAMARPQPHPQNHPPYPPSGGAETFFDWAGQTVAVCMGRHHRLPNLLAYSGGRASDVVEFLGRRGFKARIVGVQEAS